MNALAARIEGAVVVRAATDVTPVAKVQAGVFSE